ncbi:ATP-grasp domain-containing protein [Verrucomicrobiota bacterium sgz303538]
MRVYVQQKRGGFPNINYYNAWLGFQELGYETIMFEETTFDELHLTRESIVTGEIPIMLAAFTKLGILYTPLQYIPQSLHRFAARRIWTSTLGEVRNAVASGEALFAKPLEGTPRYFKGQVLRTFRDLIRTAHCDPAMPLWCSELVDFVSEYRVFVCEGEIVGLKHYSGDFRIFPDWPTVEEVMASYTDRPAGFGLDFGVTRDGRTLIVEQNDGFSLGCYGLHHVIYAELLAARWNQIAGPV